MKRGLLLVLPLLVAACGEQESVAPKSAAASRDAQAKAVPVGGNYDHGGHAATATTTGAAAVDHSAHGTGADPHAGMNHGAGSNAATMDHSAHGAAANAASTDHSAHGAAASHAAMGHGTATNAQRVTSASTHAGHSNTANAHSQHRAAPAASGAHVAHTPAAGHDQHAGTQHGTSSPVADPHAQHRQQPAAAAHTDHSQHAAAQTSAPVIATAPRSNAEMQRVQPAATLGPDAFDSPAATSVAEAAKATHSGGHEGHATRGITPGEDRENPPTPMPATRDGSASTPAVDHSQHGAATVYACPMHPEVTSDKPGTCPKCGMALLQKK